MLSDRCSRPTRSAFCWTLAGSRRARKVIDALAGKPAAARAHQTLNLAFVQPYFRRRLSRRVAAADGAAQPARLDGPAAASLATAQAGSLGLISGYPCQPRLLVATSAARSSQILSSCTRIGGSARTTRTFVSGGPGHGCGSISFNFWRMYIPHLRHRRAP
jgi:hypothetical protein